MKFLFAIVLAAVSSLPAFAQDLPVCSETISINCLVPEAETKSAFMNMMLYNLSGLKMLARTGKNGLMLEFLSSGKMTITVLSATTIKYELGLTDCRGTDNCIGHYLWTVDEKTVGDNYTYQTTYKNTIKKL